MPRPIHFEIHASDPERAMSFYRALFGWEFTKWEGPMPYWLVRTGAEGTPGIDGGLLLRHGAAPAPGAPVSAFICTMDVADVDASVAQGTSLGGTVALPKMAVPGVGWLAYLLDTEGNIFGMMQNDPNAK